MSEKGQAICGCVCCIAVIIIILIASSFATLPINTWGLDYNGITKTVSRKPLTSGIHFLGVGHSFISYSKTQLQLDFRGSKGSIQSRSQDGLTVVFPATVQYTLNQNTLYQLYSRYGPEDDYEQPCSRYIIDTLNDQAALYKASQFFTERTIIQDSMRQALTPILEEKCFMQVQVLTIETASLPSQYLSALQATNVAIQEALTVKQQEQNTQISMATAVEQATIAAPIVVNNAKAKIQAKMDTNLAEMQAFADVTASESAAYADMKTKLGFTTDASLLKFIKIQAIGQYNPKSLMIGVQDL